ncbi:SIS domain-containing protein [Microlunatus panaciterrae]|uniref:Fructoselysine-6-P-deglycase FrlB-like protein n=1 Tax=Microlunatus panaciterrae TaxID=400768 RepID=A0ABS2RGQ1_9ACTN|nr:SIS domain-containing protein [Microlunatus panaciterrae]MBM7798176.1 fructoselysine-6-P-deglycase FrlB-like protein [Microlunatus panaciterrae]
MTFFVEEEILSQPECWTRAVQLAPSVEPQLPRSGERVAFVGCGTSWFVAQIIASWRESLGLGESDAFTATEFPTGRRYDRVVALTRSGTTTEVVDLLGSLQGRVPTMVVTGDLDTPVVGLADQVVDLSFADEQSVVQTRFATSTLALFRAAFGFDLAPVIAAAEEVLTVPLNQDLVRAEQMTFLGRGWTIGVAHEAALKLRETSSSWAESYPAMDYRHGPISIAAPGRVVWMFGTAPQGLAEDVAATGATFVESGRDALAELVLLQRVAVARAIDLGLNPDQPRSLTRSVVLSD